MKKSEFKALVKQCLIEILQEGLGESSFSQPSMGMQPASMQIKVENRGGVTNSSILDSIAKQHQNGLNKKNNMMMEEKRKQLVQIAEQEKQALLEQKRQYAMQTAQITPTVVESAPASFISSGATNATEMSEMRAATMNENILPFDPLDIFGKESVGIWETLAGIKK